MRDRRRAGVLLLIAAAAVIVGAQGCSLLKPNPTPPATRLTPTIVGIVSGFDSTSTARIYKLTDGRTVARAFGDDELQGGGSYAPGNLLLARTTAQKYLSFLDPVGPEHPGCWEAEGMAMTIWDEGDSLLIDNGIASDAGVELSKAPGFHDDAISELIDGRKLWTREANVTWSICVNITGQVEWISSAYRRSSPSSTRQP